MHHISWTTEHLGIGPLIIYAVPFLLLGEHLFSQSESASKVFGFSRPTLVRIYRGLLSVTLVLAMLMVGRILWRTIVSPPGWDFQALWLYGRVADSGQNPYLPDAYPALAGPGPFVENFQEEVIHVGAMYPPPTLLVFGAIGWMPLRAAIVPWMILQTVAFVLMVMFLWRLFLPERGGTGLALMFVLALLLPGSIATFGHGQVNFMAVLFVLMAWKARQRASAGVWLVAATVMKLLYGALWIYPILRKQWRAAAGIAVATVCACLASIVAFGWTNFMTYITDNPAAHRMPSSYFALYVNQSLLGASLRLFPYHMPVFGMPTHNPLYVVSALIVAIITGCILIRLPHTQEGDDLTFTLLILSGMLVYPWTLSNYFVLLLIPVGHLWLRRVDSPLGYKWAIIVISAIYPITYFANGLYCILATLLLWTTFCIMGMNEIRNTRGVSNADRESHALAVS